MLFYLCKDAKKRIMKKSGVPHFLLKDAKLSFGVVVGGLMNHIMILKTTQTEISLPFYPV